MCENIHNHDDPRYGCSCHLHAIEHAEDDPRCRCWECNERRQAQAEHAAEMRQER